jgi:hypothetical protein
MGNLSLPTFLPTGRFAGMASGLPGAFGDLHAGGENAVSRWKPKGGRRGLQRHSTPLADTWTSWSSIYSQVRPTGTLNAAGVRIQLLRMLEHPQTDRARGRGCRSLSGT